jgi:hypothetical protein
MEKRKWPDMSAVALKVAFNLADFSSEKMG